MQELWHSSWGSSMGCAAVLELRPYQQAFIDGVAQSLRRFQRVVGVAPTACHSLDAEILMYDGSIRRAADVNVGDLLMGPDSQPRRVREIHSGRTTMYRVTPGKFDPYVVTKDHLLCLYRTPEEKGQEARYETLAVQEWNTKAECFKHIRYLYRSGFVQFESSYESKISPYVLGTILCDADETRLRLVKPYKEFVTAWEAEAERFGLVCNSRWLPDKNCYEVRITHGKRVGPFIQNDFHRAVRFDFYLGVRRLTHEMKTSSKEFRLQLLAGILDCDGSYDKEKNCYEITFKSFETTNDVRFLALSLGLHVSNVATKMVKIDGWDDERPYYRIHIGGNVWEIPCRVKISRQMEKRQRNHLVSKFEVEEIGEGYYVGWSVDGNSPTYLNSDFQVIHNSGKSVIIGGIVARYLARYPDHRVLVLCHQGELLLQNEQKINAVGVRSTSVYCSGTSRKEKTGAVVLASRDSLGRNPACCGYFHLILVDEAHLVGSDEDSKYQQIFAALSPRFIVGLTGTPWRLDNGLIYGKGKFWEACAFRISMEEIRDAGFLVPYRLPPTVRTLIDTSSVKLTGGDFNSRQLTQVSITDEVVRACLAEWWIHAPERRTSLFFCCSRDHAAVVMRHLATYTPSVAYLDGTTSKSEREAILRNARVGRYRAIVNVDVLTTGVDIPIIDCIVFLRATNSVSLFVQAAGRGLRPHPDKEDVLIIDCAGNFERFGQLENPRAPKGKKGVAPEVIEEFLAQEGIALIKEEAPQKTCPACETPTHAAATKCQECGHVFFNHFSSALTDAELAEAGIYALQAITATETETRKGSPCVIVCYQTQCGKEFKEWLFHKNLGYQKWLAEQKLRALESGASHVRVLYQKEKKYPKLSPLKIQSSESSSLISLTWVSLPGDRTRG